MRTRNTLVGIPPDGFLGMQSKHSRAGLPLCVPVALTLAGCDNDRESGSRVILWKSCCSNATRRRTQCPRLACTGTIGARRLSATTRISITPRR